MAGPMQKTLRFHRPLLAALALVPASCAAATTLTATPVTFAKVAAKAKDGDRIVLAAGNYGDVRLPPVDHAKPVTIDASRATARSLTIKRPTAGWTWRGGVIDSPLPPGIWFNITMRGAKRIEIAGVTLTGGFTGVQVNESQDVVLRNNLATGLQSDGFNIMSSQRVSVIGNTCRDFRPLLPIYDPAGKLIKDGTHDDCVQLWSNKGGVPTRDITIVGNTARGYMQGIGVYGNPGPPVENITVEGNDLELAMWHGINIADAKGVVVARNNKVRAVPGARQLNAPFHEVKPWLKTPPGAVTCGNVVRGVADRAC